MNNPDTSKVRKNILHVTHSWGGGIPVYVSDLEKILSDSYNMYVLKCDNGKVILKPPSSRGSEKCYQLPSGFGLLDMENPGYRGIFEKILAAYDIDLVHVNISLSHTFDVFYSSFAMNIPVVYTVHDYFYICPTFHLVDRNGMHCHVCEYGNEDKQCLDGHTYITDKNFNSERLYEWRSEFNVIKKKIALFIFPSETSKKIFQSFYKLPEKVCKIIPHGISVRADNVERGEARPELRVGILGTMLKHKGEMLYKEVLQRMNNEKIQFHHFGDGSLDSEHVISHGEYSRDNIAGMLNQYNIDVVLLLSTWPETFSYTLSEAMIAGTPPVVTNIGAQYERVKENEIGWYVDYHSVDEICDLLEHLQSHRSEVADKRNKLRQLPKNSMEIMRSSYEKAYNHLLTKAVESRYSDDERSRAASVLEEISVVCDSANPDDKAGALELFEKSLNKVNG